MTFPGGDDLGGLFEGLSRLQRQLEDAEAVAADTEVVGTAGGGAVQIRAAGEFEFRSVEIDPATFTAGDVALVEDLVLAALHDTVAKLLEARQVALGTAIGDALGSLLGSQEDFGGNLDDDGDDDPDDDDDDEDNGGEQAPGGELPRSGQ